MSRRCFTRHFRKYTGSSVSQWLLGQRLALAQRLLETTAQPIERVAERAGFGSTLSLRQHFSVAFNTTPSIYRREFRPECVNCRSAAERGAHCCRPCHSANPGRPYGNTLTRYIHGKTRGEAWVVTQTPMRRSDAN